MKKALLLTTGLFSLMAQGQVTSGLTARFEFNGDLTDQKGGNNAKAYNCDYVTDRQGNANSALYIKGDSLNKSFVNLGSGTNLKPASGSISLWFNPDAVNNLGGGFDYNPIILARNEAGASSFFEAYCLYMKRGDKKMVAITTKKGGSPEKYIWSIAPVNLDNWYHSVICFNNDSLWFYLNNVLQGRLYRGFTSGYEVTDSVMMGMSHGSSNKRYFTGTVDDVRIYNQVLSASQVDSLYKMQVLQNSEIKEGSHEAIVYPNPSDGIVYFGLNTEVMTYSVKDATGRLVLSGKKEQSVDLSMYQGMYFIEYTDLRGFKYSAKVIVE